VIDWQDKVERPHLVCAVSEQPIPPGSAFFSALVLTAEGFRRLDVLPEHWDPEQIAGLLSWWRQTRPEETEDRGPRMVNHAVLLSIFHDLKESTQRPQQCFAWLLALLLTRARKLRFLHLDHQGDESWMVVEERGTGQAHRIRDPHMSEEEEQRGQEDLSEIFEQ